MQIATFVVRIATNCLIQKCKMRQLFTGQKNNYATIIFSIIKKIPTNHTIFRSMKPIELCTLRGHLNDITCNRTLLYWRKGIVSFGRFKWVDHLVGHKILRRPNCVWKGHDSNIVTLRQICNGLLLTHSKDFRY